MSDIQLTSRTSQALFNLTNRTRETDRTATRLSTGREVNGPQDNAQAFLQASTLLNNASDFTRTLEQIGQSTSSLATAVTGTNAIDTLIGQQRGLLAAARSTTDTGQLAQISQQINELSTQITNLANDTSFSGQNLIGTNPTTQVTQFSQDPTSNLTVQGQDLTSNPSGLNLPTLPSNGSGLSTPAQIDAVEQQLTTAQSTVQTTQIVQGSNIALLNTRTEFNQQIANINQAGAETQTNADLNEEAARAVVNRVASQIGTNTLSLSAQFENSIVRLFSPQ